MVLPEANAFAEAVHRYSDVIMSAMASQITAVSMVSSTVCSDAYNKKTKNRVTGLYEGKLPVTGEFPSQRASNAENVSIWWRHHDPINCLMACFYNNDNSLCWMSFRLNQNRIQVSYSTRKCWCRYNFIGSLFVGSCVKIPFLFCYYIYDLLIWSGLQPIYAYQYCWWYIKFCHSSNDDM